MPSAARLCAAQGEAETDELLLLDEDMLDVDPEQLPRRLLSDFSIYNAEACPRTSAPTALHLPAGWAAGPCCDTHCLLPAVHCMRDQLRSQA